MSKSSVGKVKLTTRQILLYLVDGIITFSQPFDRHQMYRKSIADYFRWRDLDKKRFNDNLKRLEREGLIKIFLENNQGQIELTKKGQRKVKMFFGEDYEFQYPKIWDCKWRLVIFDIPKDKNRSRDLFRNKLKEIGFYQLQESVFVFPFDCKEIVDYFVDLLVLRRHVQYVIAETIESQIDLLALFYDRDVLKETMMKRSKKSKENERIKSE